jgi:outer membrane immunogenic protein
MKISTLAAGVALSALMATGAVAADVYTGDKSLKDDANYANVQVVNWTGFYIGGQVGYGKSQHDMSLDIFSGKTATAPGGFDTHLGGIDGLAGDGFVGGGRVGYDVAMGRFVLGVFGEYNVSNIETDISNIGGAGLLLIPPTFPGALSLEKDNEWSVGARAGVVVAPRTLAYILAAYTQTEYSLNGLSPAHIAAGFDDSKTFDGVTVGAGVEYAIAGNIFLGIEGTYSFYGEEEWFNNCGATGCANGNGRLADELDELKVMGTLKIKLNSDLRDITRR